MKILRLGLFLLCILFFLTGCEKNTVGPDYQKEISVFGYLWGNEPVNSSHAVLVAYTQPITQIYDIQSAGIRGADVSLTHAASAKVTLLRDTPDRPGFYFNDSLTVLPRNHYRLRVRVDGKEVTAETAVPPVLKLTTTLRRDTVNVVRQKDLSRTMPIFIEGESPDQVVLADMYCNEPFENAEYVRPFDNKHAKPGNRNEYDGGANGPPRHIMGMGRLKEMISPDYPDGRHVIDWYSSMIVFLGSNTLTVMAIDGNYHKYLYSEHPEIDSGVQGGIGVFGSVCGEKFMLQVVK